MKIFNIPPFQITGRNKIKVKISPWQHWKHRKSATSSWAQSAIWGRYYKHWCIKFNTAEKSVTQYVKRKAPVNFHDFQLFKKIFFSMDKTDEQTSDLEDQLKWFSHNSLQGWRCGKCEETIREDKRKIQKFPFLFNRNSSKREWRTCKVE